MAMIAPLKGVDEKICPSILAPLFRKLLPGRGAARLDGEVLFIR